jgi:hypothetical protein
MATMAETFVSSDPNEISVLYDALLAKLDDLHHGLYEGTDEEKQALSDLWTKISNVARAHQLIY